MFLQSCTLAYLRHTSHTVISLSCCHWLLLKTNGAGGGESTKNFSHACLQYFYYFREGQHYTPAHTWIKLWTRRWSWGGNLSYLLKIKKTKSQPNIHFLSRSKLLTAPYFYDEYCFRHCCHGCLHQIYEMPARTDRVPGISTLIEDQNTVSSDCAKAAILYSGLLNRRKKIMISYCNCYNYNYRMISHKQWGHQPIQE